MRTDHDNIKNIFSSKLSNLEQEVPVQIWDRIAEKLPDNKIVVPAKKISIFRQITIAASIAAVLTIGILLFNDSSEEKAKQIVNNFNTNIPNPNLTITTGQETHPEKDVTTQHKKSNVLYAYTPEKNISDTTTTIQLTDEPTVNTIEPSKDKVQGEEKTQNKSIQQEVAPTDLEKKIQEFTSQAEKATTIFEHYESEKKTGFTLAFEGNTGFSKDNSKGTVTNSLRKTSAITEYNPVIDGMQQNIKDINVKYDHRQPISFGLLVTKDITPKLALETGIVYTYISSRIYSERMSTTKREDYQSFYYLGLPITLNYSFAKWGKAQFYGSVGGIIQKDISGRYSEEQISFENKGSNTIINKEKIHQNKPQLSITSGVGVTYPLYNKLHIYTTIGGAYFIDANNKYRTIYSDRKFQLDLNVGLKVKF